VVIKLDRSWAAVYESGDKPTFHEPLANYTGVSLRQDHILLANEAGAIDKPYYLVDLDHPENTKTIPLYRGTLETARKRQEQACRVLRLPKVGGDFAETSAEEMLRKANPLVAAAVNAFEMTERENDQIATPARPALKAWRVVLGFFLAPIIPSFVIVPLLFISVGGEADLSDIFSALSGWTMLASFFTVPTTLFVGVPLFFVFRWRGWISWQAFALGGATLGLLFGAFMASVFFIVATTISGTVGALTLWVCAFGDRKAIRLCGMVFGLIVALVLGVALLGNLVGS
jgi:hypothetical protein